MVDDRLAGNSLRAAGAGARTETQAEVVLEALHGRTTVLLLELGEAAVAGVALAVPLVGEAPRGDVFDEPAHPRQHIEVVVSASPRQLAVLAGRGVVLHLPGVALLTK